MNLMAYNLTSFGSRFSLIFDEHNKRLKHGALGMFLEHTSELVCGVKSDEGDCFFPFSDLENNFEALYMESTQNSVTYKGVNKEHGYNLDVKFTSPFAPENEKLMVAPFFYVDVKLTKNTRPHNLVRVKKNIEKGTFVFGVKDPELTATVENNNIKLTYDINTESRFVLGDFARTLKIIMEKDGEQVKSITCNEHLSSKTSTTCDGMFCDDFDFNEKEEFTFSYVWATHQNVEFVKLYGEDYDFLYTSHFKNAQEVIDYAWNEKTDIMTKSNFYDDMIESSSLSRSWKDFIAFTFQSYKLNTLYVVTTEGKKSFSVWEGNCMYNSTMDVEYNDGLFYYTMCKEVLEGMFEQWANTDNGSGFIDHDLGWCFTMQSRSCYPHPMKIEENCNFMLMLHAYCKINGKLEVAQKHFDVMKSLVDYMISADTTGNGIANEGTSNTIDDSIPAIQHAKEQTYLAIKSATTFQVFAEIATMLGDEEYATKARLQSEKIMKTVESELWCEDHYGVCLDTCQDGYTKFMTKEPLFGPMQGRDEYSIYAENGILYPMMANFELKNLDYSRMKENIYNANIKCDTVYGCNHSENSDSVWISQNLWRDFSAAYLGHDFLDNVDKYWEFQKVKNTNGKLNLFIDTVGENALWFYPRGLTSTGVLFAMLRLKIDGIKKVIEIAPLRKTMRMPITAMADFKNCRVPVVVVTDGKVSIENSDMLDGFKIEIKN